jgi:4-hydroxymandelate oxidase
MAITRRKALVSTGLFAAAGALPVKASPTENPPGAAAAPPPGAGPVCLTDYEPLAKARIPAMAWEYISGGAGDEATVRWNREAYERLRLKPRVLVDVSMLDTRVTLVGTQSAHPILLAPTAYHRLVHPEGELATARGAGAAGATMVVSSFATTAIEDIARVATSLVPALRAAGPRLHGRGRAARRGGGLPRPLRHGRHARLRSAQPRGTGELRAAAGHGAA